MKKLILVLLLGMLQGCASFPRADKYCTRQAVSTLNHDQECYSMPVQPEYKLHTPEYPIFYQRTGR